MFVRIRIKMIFMLLAVSVLGILMASVWIKGASMPLNTSNWHQAISNDMGKSISSFSASLDKSGRMDDHSFLPGASIHDTGAQGLPALIAPVTVTISGPTSVLLQHGYVYEASVLPITATVPITYLWVATDYAPFTMTNGITNTIIYNWAIPGTKVINLIASNADGTVSNDYTVFVSAMKIYLPITFR